MSSDFIFRSYVILTVTVAVQSFHMLQHIVQVIQKFVLEFPVALHLRLYGSLSVRLSNGRMS
jgi:hypothetical protein